MKIYISQGGFFCKLLLNGASHDTKIGCNSLVWAGANKYKFLMFAMRIAQDL